MMNTNRDQKNSKKIFHFFTGIKEEVVFNKLFYIMLFATTSVDLAIGSYTNFLMGFLALPLLAAFGLLFLTLGGVTPLRIYLYSNYFAFILFMYSLLLLRDYAFFIENHSNFVNGEHTVLTAELPRSALIDSHRARFYGLTEIHFLLNFVTVSYGLDGISCVFVLLTTLLFYFSIYISSNFVRVHLGFFNALLFVIVFLLLQFFTALNFLYFYIVFEALLIPMFLMIGVWGTRGRKSFAAYLFFFYTLFGSILMLLAIAYIYVNFGSLDYFDLLRLQSQIPYYAQIVLFIFIFIGFAVKVPSLPFHLWLPEAHVEAPTIGSILLAGILLKLGGYGMLRFLIPVFPQASLDLKNFVFLVCVISVLYSAVIGLTQLDLKKIIAYSSITHMNFGLAGLFCNDLLGIEGAIYSMFSHGLISAGLFFAVGVLYERYKSRLVAYYGGLSSVMPLFSSIFFFFVVANVGIPPLSGFMSEILVLFGLTTATNKVLILALFSSSIILTINFFWLYNRVCSGPVNVHLNAVSDLNTVELLASLFLMFFVGAIGLCPAFITQYLHGSITDILLFLK